MLLPVENCWFLTGATAVGKSRVGLELAEMLGAEIISLDSMAIYRGMDIGTAKPTAVQQARLPHHLIDVADPDEDYSIDRYLEAAHATVAEIGGRGHQVLFVGGTPLYLKALLRGLSSGPPANWELRAEIEAEVAEVGNRGLYERLEQLDPLAASQIHPHDTRRLIRAVEVFRATGQPISHHQLQFDESRAAEECRVFVLRRSREEQHERINLRVDSMIERGLIEEVQQLTSDGKVLGRTAGQAVGYREVIAYLASEGHGLASEGHGLDGGDRETMLANMKTRTRRFAKRQGTWFRSLSECRYVDLEGEAAPESIAEQIVAIAESSD